MRFIGKRKLLIFPLSGCGRYNRLCIGPGKVMLNPIEWTHSEPESEQLSTSLRWKKFLKPHFLPFHLNGHRRFSDALRSWHLLKAAFHVTALGAKNSLTWRNIFYFRPSRCQWPGCHYWQRIWVQLAPGRLSWRQAQRLLLVTSAPPTRAASVESFLCCQSLRVEPGPGNSGPTPAPMSRISTRSSWQLMSQNTCDNWK